MDPQTCIKCGMLPEDILMLSCNHDLCLKCAAERLRSDLRRKAHTGILCEFCGTRTQLDPETLFEIEKTQLNSQRKAANNSLKKDIKENSSTKRADSVSSLSDARKSVNAQNLNLQNTKFVLSSRDDNSYSHRNRSNTAASEHNKQSSIQQFKRVMCKSHPEQQVLYYCFKCNCECICPECVIHGSHNAHEVQTIKKSYPVVKSHLSTHLQNINRNIDDLTNKHIQFNRQIQEATSLTDSTKRHIQTSFTALIDKIRSKEKQVLSKCDATLNIVIDCYKKNRETLDDNIKQRKEAVAQISAIFGKDQYSALNYFAGNSSSLQKLADRIIIADILVQKEQKTPLVPDIVSNQLKEVVTLLQSIDIDPSLQLDKAPIVTVFQRSERIERSLQRSDRIEPAQQQLKPTYQPQGIHKYSSAASNIHRQSLSSDHNLQVCLPRNAI